MSRMRYTVLFVFLAFCVLGCAQDKGALSQSKSVSASSAQVVVCFQPSIAFLSRELIKGTPDLVVVLAGSSPATLQTPNSVPPSHYILYSPESTTTLLTPWQDFLKETDREVYLNKTGFPLEAFFNLETVESLVDQLSADLIKAYPNLEATILPNQIALKAELTSRWYKPEIDEPLAERLSKKHIVTDRESVIPLLKEMGFTQIDFLTRENLGKISESPSTLLVKIDPRPFVPEMAKVFAEKQIPIVAFNSDDKVYLNVNDLAQERKRLADLVALAALSN